jgi:hypothetical protein
MSRPSPCPRAAPGGVFGAFVARPGSSFHLITCARWCTLHQMKTPPSPERIRLTISVTPEVHSAFSRLAAASNMSIGRAMGEWLGDNLEAVGYFAEKVEEARTAPKLVMRELHAYALGLADETGGFLEALRSGKALSPPSSNTGGKPPTKPKPARGGRK